MNEDELRRNPVLTDFVVHDLNTDPKLPYEDNSFDVRTLNANQCCETQLAISTFATCDRMQRAAWFLSLRSLTETEQPLLPMQLTIPGLPARCLSRHEVLHVVGVAGDHECGVRGLPVEADGGVQGDAPRAEAGRQGHHVLLQPLLPHQR